MAGTDERVRCFAAAIRYTDALADVRHDLAQIEAGLGGTAPPPSEMGRPVVTIGGSVDRWKELMTEHYESLLRARQDAKACGVPNSYFDFVDAGPQKESLARPPETLEEARAKENTAIELASSANELGDDYYHERPTGVMGVPGKALGCYGCSETFPSSEELSAHERTTGHGAGSGRSETPPPETIYGTQGPLTGQLRVFEDQNGNRWSGYDKGGVWNGYANAVVPEDEAERMVASWREEIRKDNPDLDQDEVQGIIIELSLNDEALPQVTTRTINGEPVRVRDFGGGYAFSWVESAGSGKVSRKRR